MTANPRAERFFFLFTVVMIAVVFLGFGSASLFLEEFVYPPAPLLIFHGIVTLSWYFLTAYQAKLIQGARFGQHKQLGAGSILLAALIVVTGYIVVSQAIADPTTSISGLSPAGSTIFPTMDLLGFMLFYGLAIAKRKTGAAHKRLMVLAGVMMLPPATARLGLSIGFEPLPGIAVIGLVGTMLLYDWRTRGRPHWASILGLIIGVGGTPMRFILGSSAEWAQIAETIY